MSKKTYFHRLAEITDNRFWINNPTPEQARLAIAAGAVSCTTNPTHSYKQLSDPAEKKVITALVQDLIKQGADNDTIANAVQQALVKDLAHIFYPLWQKAPNVEGFVSIQGNPHKEVSAQYIIDDARTNRTLGNNIIAKIPVTKAGIEAIQVIAAEDVPVLATEVMSVAQALTIFKAYQEATKGKKTPAPLYITHITGIYDQYLQQYVQDHQIDIHPDILWHAGTLVARKEYKLLREAGFTGHMMGGGARGTHHFTELVGSNVHVTINWKGTADVLIEQDGPVAFRIDTPAPECMVAELSNKLPDFAAAWNVDGLGVKDFESFGPVTLFRNMFISGWDGLMAEIEHIREAM